MDEFNYLKRSLKSLYLIPVYAHILMPPVVGRSWILPYTAKHICPGNQKKPEFEWNQYLSWSGSFDSNFGPNIHGSMKVICMRAHTRDRLGLSNSNVAIVEFIEKCRCKIACRDLYSLKISHFALMSNDIAIHQW